LYSGISFYGNTAFSLLYGKFDVTQSSNVTFDNLRYTFEDSFYQIVPNAEIGTWF